MGIGHALKKIRENKGLSQEWVASSLNVSQSTVSKVESGLLDERITVGMLKKYTKLLQIDVEDVLCSDKKNIVFQMCGNKNANGVVFNESKNISEELSLIRLEINELKNVLLKSIKK